MRRYAIDMDEVIVDLVTEVTRRWNADNGTSWKRSDIKQYDMGATFGLDKNMRSVTDFIKKLGEEHLFRDLPPCEFAVESFERLCMVAKKNGDDVIIVTSVMDGMENIYDDKRRWVKKMFPSFNMKNFIACSNKSNIDADVLVDDCYENILDWVKDSRKLGVLVLSPWNMEFVESQQDVWFDVVCNLSQFVDDFDDGVI